MGLFDGGAARIMAGIFGGIYLDAIAYEPTIVEDGEGGGSRIFTPHAAKAAYERTTEQLRAAEGYVEGDQRIFILAEGLPDIDTEWEISIDGQRWSIEQVDRDPARAYFDIRGRKSALDAES